MNAVNYIADRHVPKWAWEIDTVLRIHGALSNLEIAELIGQDPRRVCEVIRRLHTAGRVAKERRGKETLVSLPWQ